MPSYSDIAGYTSDGIGLLIATLYTIAGQAHFTDRLTPGMAQNIHQMTPNAFRAFHGLGMEYENMKRFLGALDLIAAALLWRRSTRRSGLALAVVGFGGGLYSQMYNNDNVSQVGLFLGMAIVGLGLSRPNTSSKEKSR